MNWRYGLLISAMPLLLACGQEQDKKVPPASGATPSTKTPATKEASTEPEEPDDPKIIVHLMHRFMLSLSEKPSNTDPAPDWQPLLADPSDPITCIDCHPKTGKMYAEKFDGTIRPEGTEAWEKNAPYMKALMGKWMKRANDKARGKLRSDLKCTSCHAKVPG